MKQADILIIGGGPAGLSAAIGARKAGVQDILIVERHDRLGGILNQCIHNGFGLHIFKEELTGPEYADRLIKQVEAESIPCMLNTMVLDIKKNKVVTILSKNGVEQIEAGAVILAMGCRERPRGAINIPGDRCSGIFAAGAAQELVNMRGYKIGNEAVILGSGDIGLIMARRLTFEGAKVNCVVELMPYSGGLKRNIVQCLDDFDIPLYYSSTITNIVGKERLEGVYIAEVDQNRTPILSTERFVPCDTLLLSVGLIPENELSKRAQVELSGITGGAVVDNRLSTSVDGIFACGNVLHVHDLVDNVTMEAFDAAKNAAEYLKTRPVAMSSRRIKVVPKNGIRYTVPQYIDASSPITDLEIKFRSDNVYKGCTINTFFDDEKIITQKKRIVTPGEMEKVKITAEKFKDHAGVREITLQIGVDG